MFNTIAKIALVASLAVSAPLSANAFTSISDGSFSWPVASKQVVSPLEATDNRFATSVTLKDLVEAQKADQKKKK